MFTELLKSILMFPDTLNRLSFANAQKKPRTDSRIMRMFFVRFVQFVNRKLQVNDWGGRGYDDSVPGDGTKTTPAWSASLPRIHFLSLGGWSKKSREGLFSRRPLPKRGQICYIPAPQSLKISLEFQLRSEKLSDFCRRISYHHYHCYSP